MGGFQHGTAVSHAGDARLLFFAGLSHTSAFCSAQPKLFVWAENGLWLQALGL